MNSQTQVLQKMQELFKLANEGMNRADFQQAFSNVVALITKINKEMIKRQDDSFVQITAQFKQLEKEVKTASKDDFGALKTDLVSKVNTALKEQANGMKFIYDKVNSLEDGADGEDGHTPTDDELIALITPLIPAAAQEVDIDFVVKQVLEKVQEQIPKVSLGSRIGWGAHPLRILNSSGTAVEKVARHIKFGTNLTTTRSADGVVTVSATGGGAGLTELTATETPNGNLTVFTFAAASAQPTYLVVDNVWMKPTSKAGSVNWTWNGVTKATLTIPPTDEIFAFV